VTDLDRQWAQTQIEAFVDGSLPPESAERVRNAMREDSALGEQIERARELRRDLASLRRTRVPAGLLFRLMSIPNADRRPRAGFYLPATALAGIAAVAIGVGSYSIVERHLAQTQARDSAVRDFQVAMVYLQKSTAIANSEMAEAVGLGVRSAVTTSRNALQQAPSGMIEGEPNNVD
jgi:anti-sigma factor RsiW